MTEKKRAGASFTRRGDRIEATYNVPASELPEGTRRKRITAHGKTESEAQKNLLAKLASTDYRTPPPVKTEVSATS